MTAALVTRHGRDLLIPYTGLCKLLGYTIPDTHLERAVRALPRSTFTDAVAEVFHQLLTVAERDLLADDVDPFPGQAPTRHPSPCDGHDAAVLARLRGIQAEIQASPLIDDDSDAATARDLHFYDRLVDALQLEDPDEVPAAAPTYAGDAAALYHALTATLRAHTTHPLTTDVLDAVHALVALAMPTSNGIDSDNGAPDLAT